MSHHREQPVEGDPKDLDDVSYPTSKPEVLEALVENHGRFLAFLERRLGDRGAAEDVLQAAFVRGLERAPRSLDSESAVHWFFRVLQNSLVDHRSSQAASCLGAGVEPTPDDLAMDPEAQAETCRCVLSLADTLKPEYASVLKRVDVEGSSVQTFAGEAGISANNASVYDCYGPVGRSRNGFRPRAGRAWSAAVSIALAARKRTERGDCTDWGCKSRPGRRMRLFGCRRRIHRLDALLPIAKPGRSFTFAWNTRPARRAPHGRQARATQPISRQRTLRRNFLPPTHQGKLNRGQSAESDAARLDPGSLAGFTR